MALQDFSVGMHYFYQLMSRMVHVLRLPLSTLCLIVRPIVWIRAFHASLPILVSRFISILLLNSHFRSIMRLEGAITHDSYSRYYFAWCCL